jgi:hypothetical protein
LEPFTNPSITSRPWRDYCMSHVVHVFVVDVWRSPCGLVLQLLLHHLCRLFFGYLRVLTCFSARVAH